MAKNIKRAIACALCFIALGGVVACGGDEQSGAGDVTVWAASGTEKILRDVDYSSRYSEATLKISAFRNEKESGQIILSTTKDIAAYTLQLSDLTLKGDKSVKLSADSFEVFNQKYINVEQIFESGIKTPGGYYPDALLPYETAVEYQENCVAQGKNQGLWITVQPSKDQKAGVYSGSFTLTADGEKIAVPVEITVYNYTLTDETHVKSWYGLNWEWMSMGELDVTQELQEAYYDFMLEHRVNPSNLPGTFYSMTYTEDFWENFLTEAHQSAEDPRCSFYSLPYQTTLEKINDKEVTGLDFTFHEELLRQMAAYSLEHKTDLFKKGGFYFVFLDEFDAASDDTKRNNAGYVLDAFWKYREALTVEALFGSETGDAETEALKLQLLESAKGLYPFVPGEPYELDTERYEDAKIVPVPRIYDYDLAAKREGYNRYAESAYGQKWVYTATNLYPYTSYTIETPAISPRLNGWMMYDYGISGDLYWETTMYHQFDSNMEYEYSIQDQFENTTRYPGYNGEGKLLYAGREYGIYGPVGTIRLQAVRDAHEDYDLLYELEALYRTQGGTAEGFNSILKLLVKDLYYGTKELGKSDNIEILNDSRDTLAELFNLYSTHGVVVQGYETSAGKGTLTLTAPKDFDGVLKINGQTLQGREQGEYLVYTCQQSLEKAKNEMVIRCESDGENTEFTLSLGAKQTAWSAQTLQSYCSVNAGGELVYDDENACVKFSPVITEGEERKALSVKVDFNTLQVDQTKETVRIRLYFYGADEGELEIKGKFTNAVEVITFGTYTLYEGWNEIELNVDSDLQCKYRGEVDYLRFVASKESTFSFGLGEITIVG